MLFGRCICIAALLTTVVSCNINTHQNEKTVAIIRDTVYKPLDIVENPLDTFAKVRHDTGGITQAVWCADIDDSSGDIKMIRLAKVNSDTLTPEKLISILNTEWHYVQILSYFISKDTIFVDIPYSRILANDMGLTGALQYFYEATFTLTELKGINFVHFNFAEGEEASPDTYSRESLNVKVEDQSNKKTAHF